MGPAIGSILFVCMGYSGTFYIFGAVNMTFAIYVNNSMPNQR
jgi:hypothetical protein